ncbi:aldo/keto reductase [Promicromonospora iranensis]|uniref:Aryl-alcohol dehydrogenase-like predicted oxidoreductase n=1 Tax=Promicromonospora iranensis TaxID=1105144 RepID=A0ABU2CHM0_9MICO|nr:aldo/keto reductase [Promicromonospora iranensis]MDR7380829.1 aryl-alcohol dehydrogenase-like predicted oxidoreductase [Promicromonospora iranensis]
MTTSQTTTQREITHDTPPAERLVLGAMMFGTAIDEATSFAVLDRFVDAGGRWIDTADCYAFWASESGYGGQSEELLGRWFAARPGVRDRILLATKFGAEPRDAANWPASRTGLSAAAITSQITGSLRRLGTDHVDLAWGHMEDRSVPIEETADACAALVSDGVTARIGLSNHPAWRVERARQHAVGQDKEPFSMVQHAYSYLQPRPGTLMGNHRFGRLSDELVDLAAVEGLDIWAYTPLLSGAYDNPTKQIPEVFDHPGSSRRLAVLDDVAAQVGASRGQVVLAWLAARGIRPMLGGSKVHQLDAAVDAMELELPAELLERMNGVDVTPPSA